MSTRGRRSNELTGPQEIACEEFVRTGNRTLAYKAAYNCENMKHTTCIKRAHELFKIEHVRIRVNELRKQAADEAKIDLVGHLTDLKMIRDLAIAEGKYTAAVQAEISRARAAGLYELGDDDEDIVPTTLVFTVRDARTRDRTTH